MAINNENSSSKEEDGPDLDEEPPADGKEEDLGIMDVWGARFSLEQPGNKKKAPASPPEENPVPEPQTPPVPEPRKKPEPETRKKTADSEGFEEISLEDFGFEEDNSHDEDEAPAPPKSPDGFEEISLDDFDMGGSTHATSLENNSSGDSQFEEDFDFSFNYKDDESKEFDEGEIIDLSGTDELPQKLSFSPEPEEEHMNEEQPEDAIGKIEAPALPGNEKVENPEPPRDQHTPEIPSVENLDAEDETLDEIVTLDIDELSEIENPADLKTDAKQEGMPESGDEPLPEIKPADQRQIPEIEDILPGTEDIDLNSLEALTVPEEAVSAVEPLVEMEESSMEEEPPLAEDFIPETEQKIEMDFNDDSGQNANSPEEVQLNPDSSGFPEPEAEEDLIALDLPGQEEQEENQEELSTTLEKARNSDSLDKLPAELKQEIKEILTYMDELLESLPEEKIQEFAQSEHFEVYKKIFEELGITN